MTSRFHCVHLSLVVILLASWLPAAAVEKIVVLGLFKEKAVLEVDGKRRVLETRATSPEGVKLISADSTAAILDINGQQARYTLGTQINNHFTPPPPQATVQIWPDGTHLYQTDGSINGYPVKFLIDTGATTIAMNRQLAKRIGLNYQLDGDKGIASTASGTATAYYLKLARVKVGAIELNNVEASVIDGDFPRETLLGMSFLNRVELTRNSEALSLTKKP